MDEIDTDSSIPSVSERNDSNSSQIDMAKTHVYMKRDTYSIVGSLNQNSGGIPVNGTSGGLYQGGAQLLSMYGLGRRDLTSQPLPLPGWMLGYGKGWGCGSEPVPESTGATNSLPLRMEEFLKFRLDQVTFDLSQPPYDSLQTYEFEGRDSRAESLSSLESEGEKEEEDKAAGGMDELNLKFQRLVEIIKEREKEKEEKKLIEDEASGAEGGQNSEAIANETDQQETEEEREKEKHRWDF